MNKFILLISVVVLSNYGFAQDFSDDKSGTIVVRKTTIAVYAERAGLNNNCYQHVTSFYFSSWGGAITTESSTNNELTPRMQARIRDMVDSATVYDRSMSASFERIRAIDENGKEIKLPSFTVAIQ
ncbi:MAG: hypothetical protein JKY52_10630 [Flavobacteriales bacterium]|nr:hypothetical protein [Flavobacteriales bacterium]